MTLYPLGWLQSKRQTEANVSKDVENGTLIHCWWEGKISHWKTVR